MVERSLEGSFKELLISKNLGGAKASSIVRSLSLDFYKYGGQPFFILINQKVPIIGKVKNDNPEAINMSFKVVYNGEEIRKVYFPVEKYVSTYYSGDPINREGDFWLERNDVREGFYVCDDLSIFGGFSSRGWRRGLELILGLKIQKRGLMKSQC